LRFIAPFLAYAYLRFVGLTTLTRIRGREHVEALHSRGLRCLYAFWHERQAFFTYTHRGERASVLVSRSKDGEIIARIMALFGIGSCRGSSTRGGVSAARELSRALQSGDIGITPDGPKGPPREVKPGVVALARSLGVPIVPITNALSRRLLLGSWDRFQLPLPFGRALVLHAPPILVGPQDDLEAKARELKETLDRITEEADREVLGQ